MEQQGKKPLTPAGVLQHRRFSTVMWSMFLLLSGIMVFFNVYLKHWGIGTFDSISRCVDYRSCFYMYVLADPHLGRSPRWIQLVSTRTL